MSLKIIEPKINRQNLFSLIKNIKSGMRKTKLTGYKLNGKKAKMPKIEDKRGSNINQI